MKLSGGSAAQAEDEIVTEYPLTVKLNGEEAVTMVSSPEYLEDMVIGYLASEGFISKLEDIKELWIQEKAGFAHVTLSKENRIIHMQNKRYLTSCCGMSRPGFVFVNDARVVKPLKQTAAIHADACFSLMNELQRTADIFQSTGGVHNAALCDENGIIVSRMDIGRHNALDKLYGYCLKNAISTRGKILVFSGRISSEILLKTAKIGCEIVLSKSAPTTLALNLAEELGITAVGFIRNSSLNIYTHPNRIKTS
ncbi:formate dehydrogenase accessory sulfurtransferase FdhD [Metabacillus indicus]|uniref:formate dehydrogenase accessory sulfurtransferase FdhD n=1 Tax=Metabacillus indicus TaxID=246786 RepID=UPI003CE6A333